MLLCALCRGMENLIKSQKEIITDLEAKIQANLDELKKVICSKQECMSIF